MYQAYLGCRNVAESDTRFQLSKLTLDRANMATRAKIVDIVDISPFEHKDSLICYHCEVVNEASIILYPYFQ